MNIALWQREWIESDLENQALADPAWAGGVEPAFTGALPSRGVVNDDHRGRCHNRCRLRWPLGGAASYSA